MEKNGGRHLLQAVPGLCTGCRICELVCSVSKAGKLNVYLARLKVVPGKALGSHFPVICRHCARPPCKEACPVEGAMVTDPATGAVAIREEVCIGCLACMEACPFGAIQAGPEGEVLKCDLCGGDPLCVRHCPPRPANSLPHLPLPEQACLQYVPFYAANQARISLSQKGE